MYIYCICDECIYVNGTRIKVGAQKKLLFPLTDSARCVSGRGCVIVCIYVIRVYSGQ